MTTPPSAVLNNGLHIPLLGFGTYIPKTTEDGSAGPDENPDLIAKAVTAAIKVGYRHFDCAAYYANERGIGNALQDNLHNGVVKRHELFVGTKVWNTDHSYARAQAAVLKSLKKLQLDYIDLIYIHWPCNFREGDDPMPCEPGSTQIAEGHPYDYLETYAALEDLVDAGKIKSIGLSNFDRDQVQRIIDNCRIKPAVLQIEVHVYLQQYEYEMFCRERGIVVVAYSPLAAAHRDDVTIPRVEDNDVLTKIAQSIGNKTTPQQVALAFLLQRGMAIIPRALSERHMQSNFDAANIRLTTKDMEAIKALDKKMSMFPRMGWENLKYFPKEALGSA